MDAAEESQPVAKPPLRDRVWSFKAMLLVAFATLIVGGLTGAGLTALVSDDGHRRDHGRVSIEQVHPGMPYAPPKDGRKPWKHRHFYWNDGPRPMDPGMPSGPDEPEFKIVPPPRERLNDLEKRLDELEKKQTPKN